MSTESWDGKILFSRYDLDKLEFWNERSEQVLALCYVCHQLRAETKLLPFQYCPSVANAMLFVKFLGRLDATLAGQISEVIVLSPSVLEQQKLVHQL
jgi:hypothetical protein